MLGFGRETWRALFFLAVLFLNSHFTWPTIAISLELPSSSLTTSGIPAQLEVLPGNDVYLLDNVAIPLVARVRDNIGQPIPEVLVTFQVTVGSGLLGDMQINLQVATNEQGEATTNITVPTVLEPTCVVASVEALTPVTAAFTGVPAEALRPIEVSGNNQEADPGQVLDEPFVVRVEAQFDTPIVTPCIQPANASEVLIAQAQSDTFHARQSVLQQQINKPVVGVRVTGEIIQGEAVFVARPDQPTDSDRAEEVTNAQGEAAFFIQVGDRVGEIVVTRLSVLDQEVDFLVVVGFLLPFGIATDAENNLVVIDASLGAAVRLDPNSGARTFVSLAPISLDVSVGDGPRLPNLSGIAVEANGSFVVTDRGFLPQFPPGVVRVDPVTGNRRVVSGFDAEMNTPIGSGIPFVTPSRIAVEPRNTLVVADIGRAAIIRVHPESGNRIIVSGCTAEPLPFATPPCSGPIEGEGPLFFVPTGIAVDTDGSLILVDAGTSQPQSPPRVVRVDPETGDRTLVSGCTEGAPFTGPCTGTIIGNGPNVIAPINIATEATNTFVIVEAAAGRNGIMRVDTATGDRNIVSSVDLRTGDIVGSGPPFGFPQSVVVEADGQFALADAGRGGVLRIDPANGNRTIVSEVRIGDGPPFSAPGDLAFEADGNLVVLDSFLGIGRTAVVRVASDTGNRTTVSDTTAGDGTPFGNPVGVAVEPNGDFVVVDNFLGALLRVNRVTGDRFIISGCTMMRALDTFTCPGDTIGIGPVFLVPTDVIVEADGNFVVADSRLGALIRVASDTGERTIISGFSSEAGALIGDGPQFMLPSSIALEPSGSFVVVNTHTSEEANSPVGRIIQVNPQTGDRIVVSGCIASSFSNCTGGFQGAGPTFTRPAAIAVKADGILVVTDVGLADRVMQVHPITGDRALVSGILDGTVVGNGPIILDLGSVVTDASGRLVVVDGLFGFKAVVDIDPMNGDRIILSK